MKALCLIFLLGAIFQANAKRDYFAHIRGVTQSDVLGDLNSQIPAPATYIFRGQVIEWNGKVGQWEFYARETGPFYASVWRINRATQQAKLVGKNKLSAEAVGYNRVEVPMPERINVRPGDVLGIYYNSAVDSTVLSMETEPSEKQMEFVTSSEIYADKLKQGKTLDLTDDLKGVVSLKATIMGTTDQLKLFGGDTPNEGHAQMYKDEKWGTICDMWFKERGWPLLYCYQLGYPGVESAMTTSEIGKSTVDESIHIHVMSPRCKPSDDITLLECPLHPKGQCAHDRDLYIECKPRYEITPAPEKPGWGIPMVYEGGMWGNICDDRDPTFHFGDNTGKTWLTAICKEIYNKGLQAVERVLNPLQVGRSFMENPDCGDVTNPTLMTDCPSGPLETECDGDLYYVQCET